MSCPTYRKIIRSLEYLAPYFCNARYDQIIWKYMYFTNLYNTDHRKFDHILPEITLHKHGTACALWKKCVQEEKLEESFISNCGNQSFLIL